MIKKYLPGTKVKLRNGWIYLVPELKSGTILTVSNKEHNSNECYYFEETYIPFHEIYFDVIELVKSKPILLKDFLSDED